MKRRALSLLLALCLLLAALPQMTIAEGAPEGEIAEAIAESPEPESVEEPEQPPIEEPEQPPVEEPEQPSEEQEPEEAPEQPSEEQEPEEEHPLVCDDSLEGEDAFSAVALGSDGVQYAGVKYLSQAAFDSMPADSQAAYIEMVDELNGLLDEGVPIYDPVFYLRSDGYVGRIVGLSDFSGNGIADFDLPGEEPAEELVAEEEPVPEPELEAEPEPEEGEPEAEAPEAEGEAVPEAEEAPAVCIEENVELAESLWPGRLEGAPAVSEGNALGVARFNTLFWDNKDFFYDQLTKVQKEIYDISRYLFVDMGERAPTFAFDSSNKKVEIDDIKIAMSALYDAYPASFEWLNWGGVSLKSSCGYDSERKVWEWSLAPVESEYYSPSDEAAAQKQVEKLVSDAYEYARAAYPSDFVYGVVSYFDDWLCENNVYKKSVMKETAPYSREHYNCHTSYGALLKGYAVCDSYAKAMSRLLDAANIPNLYAHGDVGDANHVWNYVQMPDGKYYLVDSTENDGESENPEHKSSKKFLLKTNLTELYLYSPGKMNWIDEKFDYPSISKSAYSPETLKTSALSNFPKTINISLLKGESVELAYYGDKKYNNYYRDMFNVSWYNSTPSVAAFQKNGKLKALKPGKTTLTMTFIDQAYSYDVYVCDVEGLYFRENGKATLEYTTNGLDTLEFPIDVQLGENTFTDEEIQGLLSDAKLFYSGFDTAEFTFAVEGNGYKLIAHPKKTGDVTVKLTLGNKTAALKLKIRQEIQDSWIALEYDSATYNGKKLKPKATRTSEAPSDFKFSASYSNNINAGEATVKIAGKGGYGVLEKHFTIQPAPIEGAVKITDAKAVYYNGAGQSASPTIKLGKKKLKAGVDYTILYDDSEEAPTQAGTYSLRFVGKNYSGDFSDGASHSFTINPTPLGKLSLSLKKSSIKQSGEPVSTEALGLKLKYGKKEIPASEYEVSFRDAKGNTIPAPSAPGSYKVVVRPTGANLLPTDKKPELAKSFKIKK